MSVRILIGDCREKLRELADASVNCCVTSPPYFGLRDYGTAQWEGGSADCDHVQMTTGMSDKNTLGPNGYLPETNAANVGRKQQYRHACGKCGATRIDRQMGLEPTPDEFVAGMVEVFREVRRVLRDDGTLWLNIGDSYANPGNSRNGEGEARALSSDKFHGGSAHLSQRRVTGRFEGVKQKDLIGIPWMLAFALRADGWYLRQDCIWSKPNPMPESVRDRCTKAHEYIFLLSKGPRYYYDAEAIAEPAEFNPGGTVTVVAANSGVTGRNDVGRTTIRPETRNKRSVWTVATQPFKEAHFATFPPDLIEPCILAGCPEGGTVLDPFFGAGTTGLVADRLGRNAIGIELNPEYAEIARQRLLKDCGLFADIAVEHTAPSTRAA